MGWGKGEGGGGGGEGTGRMTGAGRHAKIFDSSLFMLPPQSCCVDCLGKVCARLMTLKQ